MPRSKRPEQIRANARRSRWAGSMLACTLNTNAENPASSDRGAPSASSRGEGGGARSITASRIIRTPKVVSAEPTNSGVESPARKEPRSTSAPTASSSRSRRARWPTRAFLGRGALRPTTSPVPARHRIGPRSGCSRRCVGRSRAQVAGDADGPCGRSGRRPICASISSSSSRASRPGRSYLLRNVSTGRRRARQTSKSLSVWASMPWRCRAPSPPRRLLTARGRCPPRSPCGPACRAG